MKAIPVEAPQRSEEWFRERLGRVTASEVSKTMEYYAVAAAQKQLAYEIHEDQGIDSKYCLEMCNDYPAEFCLEVGIELRDSAARKNYKEGIVAERLTGQPGDPDGYVTYDMKWGVVNESIAIARYQMEQRCVVEEAKLMLHPDLKAGASTDGTSTNLETGEVGNVECKCLRSANHLYKIIKEEKMPEEYIPQVQMGIWFNDNTWTDFIGFDSRLPEGLKIYVERIERDDFYINNVLEPSVRRFLAECYNDERFFRAKVREVNNKEEQ